MPGPCKGCGKPNAAFGYARRPTSRGWTAEIKVWVCGAPACKERAEEWKRKADGGDRFTRSTPDPSPPKPAPKPKPDQGSLF